jgi:hypothetical protein
MKRSIDQISNDSNPSFTFISLPIEVLTKHIMPYLVPCIKGTKVPTLDSFFSVLRVSQKMHSVSFIITRSMRALLKEKAENLRNQFMIFASLDIHNSYAKHLCYKADSKSRKELLTHALTSNLISDHQWDLFRKNTPNINWKELMRFDFVISKIISSVHVTRDSAIVSNKFNIYVSTQLKCENEPTVNSSNTADYNHVIKIKTEIFQHAKANNTEAGNLMRDFSNALTNEYEHEELMRRIDESAFKKVNKNGYQFDSPFENYKSIMDIIYQLECVLINKVNNL